jgi:hypothetical protein
MTEHEVMSLGFEPDDDGTLLAPPDSRTLLTPIGNNFYKLWIVLDADVAVVAVVAKRALKLMPEPREPRVRVIHEDEDGD